MKYITNWILAAALVAITAGAAAADVINFDDAYGAAGDPATYYSSKGVTITGTYSWLIGGNGNGNPGNWQLEGTNGSAFLGCNAGDSCSPTFNFASSVHNVSLDIGLANRWSAAFTIAGYLNNNLIDSDVLTIADPGAGGGTWMSFTLDGNVDQIVVSSAFTDGFAYGLDNVQFESATPEPFSASMMLFGAGALGIGALRRRRPNCG